MKEEQRNFLAAIALSMAIIIGWQMFFAPPPPRQSQQADTPSGTQAGTSAGETPRPTRMAEETPAPRATSNEAAPTGVPGAPNTPAARETLLRSVARVPIDTPSLRGSISLRGGRIDDLVLKKYRATVEEGSPNIVLLNPLGGADAYFAETGWAPAANSKLKVPTPDTIWELEKGERLGVNTPITLKWDNGQGIIFRRVISVDENYMFTITQMVENTTSEPITLFPFARVQRHGIPRLEGFFILHEGLIGVLNDELNEVGYDDIKEEQGGQMSFSSKGGWLGITDKYWAVAVLPARQDDSIQARFLTFQAGGRDVFQADYLSSEGLAVQPGGSEAVQARIFAGAKEVALVDAYEEKYGIRKFELLIDWGWFYFITKPMFWLLHWLKQLLGNYGLAILAATVLIKLLFFPLSNKSYVSMAKMKKLQPDLLRIRELHKDDPMKQQQAMMELYRKHKVSPLAGCLPMLVQVPVFFAIYKVLFVTIDMRHAPFCCWIRDLSAPDPTNMFTLFGLLPWNAPTFLHIGVLPILMGLTMWVQMKLNPPPPDPIQQKIFDLMPILFTFLLAPFPAGLVLYWTWNNILSILQQSYIMKKHGAEIHLWENLRKSLPFTGKKEA